MNKSTITNKEILVIFYRALKAVELNKPYPWIGVCHLLNAVIADMYNEPTWDTQKVRDIILARPDIQTIATEGGANVTRIWWWDHPEPFELHRLPFIKAVIAYYKHLIAI